MRGYAAAAIGALALAFAQSPGKIAADTKLDLTADPIGFLGRAAHLWSSQAPMGQVQNQAYGYFFPHGAFFALGEVLAIPPWITQRLWWALLLWLGMVGIWRLTGALGIGSPASRVFAAIAFALSPRVLTTLGSISSETLPLMLAPWVLTPVVLALDHDEPPKSLRRLAFGSAVAIALMGAVNAVATIAAVALALGWFLLHRPHRRWLVFGAWWVVGATMACLWWVIPLAILGAVSPPFLDFIESSSVTTEWANLPEVLRGTSAWTPFVSPERVAGAVLVTEPVAVIVTGVLAAAGLTGLAMRSMRWRGPLSALLLCGLVLMCVGYVGGLGSPIAESVRVFLDGPGAALRNIHKWDPLIRVPLVLGLAHALSRVPYPRSLRDVPSTLRIFQRPERRPLVGVAIALTVALVGASSMAWTGNLAPAGAYRAVPDYWTQAASWLDRHPGRALVTPGAPFADQNWGLTRDEPLQGLADSPWAVRDAIPLTPPGAIRALDSVQRLVAAGLPSAGLAPTLAQQGIRYVVVRADLSPGSSRSARPVLAQQAIRDSPGMTLAATFGPNVGAPSVEGIVSDDALRPPQPAVAIYRVDAPGPSADRPSISDVDALPRVAGGPEVLERLQQSRAMSGLAPLGPVLLTGDATAAGLPPRPFVVTDTPTDREVDFGRVDNNTSSIRAPGDPRTTTNAAADYPTTQSLTTGQWLMNGQPGQLSVTTSSSASDATQLGQVASALGPVAAFDGDPNTSWVSGGLDSAVGQWLRLNFTAPQRNVAFTLTVGKALGPKVTAVLVKTDTGSTVMQGLSPGDPVKIVAPPQATRHVEIKAIATDNHSAGNQFAISDLSLRTAGSDVPIAIRHTVALPTLTATDQVTQWVLGQDLPGRSECVDAGAGPVRCSAGLSLAPESPGVLTRKLSVPQRTAVDSRITLRPKAGSALTALIASADPARIAAAGDGQVADPRGAPAAAVDGDPDTAWYAPQPGNPKKYRPQLTLRLPQPRPVRSLKLVAPHDQYPAHPTRVRVDMNGTTSEHDVAADGTVTLDGAVTDRIAITIVASTDVLDVNSLGFAQTAPTGIAEVQVNGQPNTDNSAARVTVSCDAGDPNRIPGLTAAGQVVRFGFTATVDQLRRGAPISATPCARTPLRLPAGAIEVAANPTDAFSVDTITLTRVDAAATTSAAPQQLSPTTWTADRREVAVNAASTDRVLTVAESVNPGWRATLAGQRLTPITVNGWQQGFVVPAHLAGTVHMTYPLDTPYRWGLLIGLLLVVALLLATAVMTRDRAQRPDHATPLWQLPGVAALGWLASMWLIAGPVGAALAVVAAAVVVVARRPSSVVVVGSCCATAILAMGPWHSATYLGWSAWAQAPAVVAVAAATAAAWPVRTSLRRVASRWRRR